MSNEFSELFNKQLKKNNPKTYACPFDVHGVAKSQLIDNIPSLFDSQQFFQRYFIINFSFFQINSTILYNYFVDKTEDNTELFFHQILNSNLQKFIEIWVNFRGNLHFIDQFMINNPSSFLKKEPKNQIEKILITYIYISSLSAKLQKYNDISNMLKLLFSNSIDILREYFSKNQNSDVYKLDLSYDYLDFLVCTGQLLSQDYSLLFTFQDKIFPIQSIFQLFLRYPINFREYYMMIFNKMETQNYINEIILCPSCDIGFFLLFGSKTILTSFFDHFPTPSVTYLLSILQSFDIYKHFIRDAYPSFQVENFKNYVINQMIRPNLKKSYSKLLAVEIHNQFSRNNWSLIKHDIKILDYIDIPYFFMIYDHFLRTRILEFNSLECDCLFLSKIPPQYSNNFFSLISDLITIPLKNINLTNSTVSITNAILLPYSKWSSFPITFSKPPPSINSQLNSLLAKIQIRNFNKFKKLSLFFNYSLSTCSIKVMNAPTLKYIECPASYALVLQLFNERTAMNSQFVVNSLQMSENDAVKILTTFEQFKIFQHLILTPEIISRLSKISNRSLNYIANDSIWILSLSKVNQESIKIPIQFYAEKFHPNSSNPFNNQSLPSVINSLKIDSQIMKCLKELKSVDKEKLFSIITETVKDLNVTREILEQRIQSLMNKNLLACNDQNRIVFIF